MKMNTEEKILAAVHILYEELGAQLGDAVCLTPGLERKARLLLRLADGSPEKLRGPIGLSVRKTVCGLPEEFRRGRVEVRFLPGRDGLEATDGFCSVTWRIGERRRRMVLSAEWRYV